MGALFLVWLTACTGTPRAMRALQDADPDEVRSAAARYELHVFAPDIGSQESVQLSSADFQRALRMLAPEVVPSSQPMEEARLLMQGGLHASLLAEMERGQVVRLTPLDEESPLEASTAAEYRRRYLNMCLQQYGGGDCLGLLADGPTLTKEDVRALALALSLKRVLRETGAALRGMVTPQAVVAMVVCTAFVYMTLWLLPEPVSKLLAASLTLAMLAWLPVHTLWTLMDGWAQLVREADRATTYEEIEEASERFSQLMGENTARVLVMLITTAIVGGGGKFVQKLPKLPGFAKAAAQAEAQGMRLSAAGEVEWAAAAEEQTFTLMVRRPGGRAAASAEEAAEAHSVTLIRHRGGNQQVFINGQRWHLRAGQSLKEVPTRDPVGDSLQAAAKRIANEWSPAELSRPQQRAIKDARDAGHYLKARLMELRFRGQWVENRLRDQFSELQWSRTGVDAVNPATGIRYEILAGTDSNMALHGRRMAEMFFRLITF
ncbi:hypothetical protein DB31_1811 [Hyalangium minutum]|uniref:Uncharacterized protein n=2 Tax=Hyalangium minutum TaxID=394096 RepID=A0A085WAT0_9BACT|nr:hypothetical protein DB31_1811 [Hyalangium minutum]